MCSRDSGDQMHRTHFAGVRLCVASALLAAFGFLPSQARAQFSRPTMTPPLAQTIPADAVTHASLDATSPADSGVLSTRANIFRRAAGPRGPGVLIMPDSVNAERGSRSRHVLVGVLLGGVAGGVLGRATAGGNTGTLVDPIANSAAVLGGMLLGAIAGGVAGALWPHS